MDTLQTKDETITTLSEENTVQTDNAGKDGKLVLSVRDLHLTFGEKLALCDINLDINQGETLGLVGEAGSGKSVLFYCILNAVKRPGKIQKGSVLFNGQDILTMPPDKLRAIRGNRIGIMVSHPKSALNPVLPIGTQIENVYLAHRTASRHEAREAAIQALRSVGINDPERRIKALPQELSGGMAQRVIVAIGLLHSPELLLADEPTAGVDVTIQRQILEMMNELLKSRNMATILASRDLGIITNYSKTIAVLQKGHIVEMGTVDTIYYNTWHPYTIRLVNAATFGKSQLAVNAEGIATTRSSGSKEAASFFCDVCNSNQICKDASLREVAPGHWVRCHG